MEEIGIKILSELGYKASQMVLGFHIPPFNSVQHIHMHAAGRIFDKHRYLSKISHYSLVTSLLALG